MPTRARDALVVAAFALVLTGLSPVITSYDSRWTIPTAVSIERHGDLNLDEYRAAVARADGYATEQVRGHTYDSFPWGTAVLITPVVFVVDRVGSVAGLHLERDGQNQQATGSEQRTLRLLEHGIASLIGALTAGVVFLFARERLNRAQSFILAGTFVVATSIWSVTTRALWSNGPAILAVAIALLIAARSRERPGLLAWLGIPVAAAYVFRPTMSIVVVAFTVYVAVRAPRVLLKYLLGGLAVGAAFVAVNLATYHEVLPSYFRAGRVGGNDDVFRAMLANLVSPSRGLFVFSPVLILVVIAFIVRGRRGALEGLDVVAAVSFVGTWIVTSTFPHWWGGHTYGPRLMSDTIPMLCWLLIPVVAFAFPEGVRARSNAIAAACFVVLVAVSSLIHARGAIDARSLDWNVKPNNVDDHPGRVWQWRDSQILSNL